MIFSPGLPNNAPSTVLPVFGPPRVGLLGVYSPSRLICFKSQEIHFLALVWDQSGRWPYPQWPDLWWSKHRPYRSCDIIRELRRECRKAGHYLAITLPKPLCHQRLRSHDHITYKHSVHDCSTRDDAFSSNLNVTIWPWGSWHACWQLVPIPIRNINMCKHIFIQYIESVWVEVLLVYIY